MTVLRWCLCGLCLSTVWLNAQPAPAQVVVWQKGQTSFPAATPEPSERTDAGKELEPNIKLLRLTAADEPTPALKYRLWVSPALRQPGDAQAALLQAQVMFLAHPERAELNAAYKDQAWDTQPLSQLAQSGAREYLAQQREILDQIDHATRLGTVGPSDAAAKPRGNAAISGPHIAQQNNRELARLVGLDARLALAEKRFDSAFESLAAGFRIAELTHESATPTMLTRLVSLAISGMMFGVVEEFSQQDGAPNLYWALASLPAEYWDLQSMLEGEADSMARVVYPLLEPIAAGTSQQDLNARLVECVRTFVVSDGDPFEGVVYAASPPAQQADVQASSKLLAGLIVLVFADAARHELPELGVHQSDQLSPVEATLRAVQLGFERGRDNIFKWGLTPTGIGDEFMAEMNMLSGGPHFLRPANIMLGMLIPALQAAESAAQRTNSVHKQLLLREALRAYAARNAGTLPTTIDALRPMPAPANPLTGKTFDYEKLSDTAAIIRREPLYPGEKQTDVRVEMR